MGDLSGLSRDKVRQLVADHRGADATPNQIGSTTGQLYRFANDLKVGDRVITMVEGRQYLVGTITSDYRYDMSPPGQPYRRSVEWVGEFSRDIASELLRKSLSLPPTVYSVSRHEDEIRQLLEEKPEHDEIDVLDADALADTLNEDARKLEVKARQFILDAIVEKYPANDFEELVGWVLTAMGFEVEGHGRGPDGGVDLIARQGQFGFEQIVVQVKNLAGPVGNGDILKLRGTREPGNKLFVSASGYTRAARQEAGTDIRLVTGLQLVDMIIEHYGELPKTFRDEVPLRRVDILVPDVEESS